MNSIESHIKPNEGETKVWLVPSSLLEMLRGQSNSDSPSCLISYGKECSRTLSQTKIKGQYMKLLEYVH
jgi:hypothetical protein